ncbi:hypothetical protein B6N60_00557 [Richelia sinica FACHB-800]|uniref:Uncharacterized protein n=1 Tax=Richelia sinica FACHB-800 TaxID=1357546 RepID=A0A975T4F7_9NOST|nr:hypothetical protein B6N60_00557 [Richelia sinica FACHB-800]
MFFLEVNYPADGKFETENRILAMLIGNCISFWVEQ